MACDPLDEECRPGTFAIEDGLTEHPHFGHFENNFMISKKPVNQIEGHAFVSLIADIVLQVSLDGAEVLPESSYVLQGEKAHAFDEEWGDSVCYPLPDKALGKVRSEESRIKSFAGEDEV